MLINFHLDETAGNPEGPEIMRLDSCPYPRPVLCPGRLCDLGWIALETSAEMWSAQTGLGWGSREALDWDVVSHHPGTRLGFLSDGPTSKHLKGLCGHSRPSGPAVRGQMGDPAGTSGMPRPAPCPVVPVGPHGSPYMISLLRRGPPNGTKGRLPVAAWYRVTPMLQRSTSPLEQEPPDSRMCGLSHLDVLNVPLAAGGLTGSPSPEPYQSQDALLHGLGQVWTLSVNLSFLFCT